MPSIFDGIIFLNESERELTKSRYKHIEVYITKLIYSIIPDRIGKLSRIKLSISSNTYSVDFFVKTSKGIFSAVDLIDFDIITSKDYDRIARNVASAIRNHPDFKKNQINKYDWNEQEIDTFLQSV